MYWHEATFVGGGQFPVDMLRYDRCFPSDSSDAQRITDSVRGVRDKMPDGTPPLVTVVHYDQYASFEWTEGRWQSFGWVKMRSVSRKMK